MEILIFKTNITSQKKARKLSPIFNSFVGIKDWHVDTKDVDNVLRIETDKLFIENEIIHKINSAGYQCNVLID